MKTIGFYSYKGGSGKSLAAANLAVSLSRTGKNCVLVDFDVEAPSLHNKFLPAGKGAIGKGGFIGLMTSHFDHEDWQKGELANIKPKPVAGVERFVYLLPDPWDPRTEGDRNGAGSIHLLAAGDVYGPHYWDVIWSPLWHELFTAYQRYADEVISPECFERILKFFLDLKNGLAALDPAPDYMILDFRPGATELSTTLINAWVDTLVYTFAFNEDNIDYLARTFDRLLDAGIKRNHVTSPFDIKVSLSRAPTTTEYRGDRSLFNALRGMGLKWDALHILHSDRDLESCEELRTGYRMPPQNRRLTHDYMKLFEELIDPSRRPIGWLANEIGLPADLEERDRIFNLESKSGALINPNDDSRNVAFKVETFQLLLKGLEEGLGELIQEDKSHRSPVGKSAHEKFSDPEGTVTRWLATFLRSAGQKCGQCFGSALAESWSCRVELGIEARIREWCKFDSDVGFGKFELDSTTIAIKGPRLIACDIWLRESFLTPAKDTRFKKAGDHKFCSLMTGYIQGVLSEILKCPVEVTHEPEVLKKSRELLGATSVRSESCIFHAKG